jgi:enoyl-CoA hydratase/carnithine racemase
MVQSYETLKLEVRDDHVLLVTFNRPEASNALNTAMGRDMLDLFTGLVAASEPYRCVVLTGAGEKAFCAGGDLKERRGMTQEAWQAQHAIFERMTLALVDCPIPVLAAVNGAAYGGGCEMVGAVDFAYASENARFALTEVTLGIMPGAAGTQTLPRSVGPKRAKEIVFTGLPFTAEQALAWGLVNKVTPPEALLEETLATAARIAGNAPLSIRQAKKSVHYGAQMDLRTAMFFEIEAYNRLIDTEDRHEGVLAFNEKRKPAFKGR